MPDTAPEEFVDTTVEPAVRGFLHRPAQPNGPGLVLTHGAGGNSQGELLRNLTEAFTDAGFTVLRVNLPFRQQRTFGPPKPADAEIDREGLRNAVAALSKMAPTRLFLGGHSYGGRQATMLCASLFGLVDALLLLSYPLHPPRKPTQLRTQHFPSLQTPAFFVHGSRDGFGSIDEIESACKLIPAKTRILGIEGGGHDLKTKTGDIAGKVVSGFLKFVGN